MPCSASGQHFTILYLQILAHTAGILAPAHVLREKKQQYIATTAGELIRNLKTRVVFFFPASHAFDPV